MKKGLSPRVIERLDKARALSTRKQYKSSWTLFTAWAVENGIDPSAPSLPVLANFHGPYLSECVRSQ